MTPHYNIATTPPPVATWVQVFWWGENRWITARFDGAHRRRRSAGGRRQAGRAGTGYCLRHMARRAAAEVAGHQAGESAHRSVRMTPPGGEYFEGV